MEVSVAKAQPTNKDLDEWIEQLFECKQLSESQVKVICDKVSIGYHFECVQIHSNRMLCYI